jgi:DNA-directed RNA polymerase specialized sigma24 family protein
MPNGQNREVYTRLCHEFIEENYERLSNYARKVCYSNEEYAKDVLHTTFTVLLEGRHNIDFTGKPITVFYDMLKCYANPNRYSVTRNMQWVPFDDNEFVYGVKKDSDISFLATHFDLLTKRLTKTQRIYLEMWLDGLTNKEMQQRRPSGKTNIQILLTEARKRIRRAAIALLQADSLGVTEHPR